EPPQSPPGPAGRRRLRVRARSRKWSRPRGFSIPTFRISAVARILLLGSTGFLGRGVGHKILDAGHQMRVLVRDPLKAAAFTSRWMGEQELAKTGVTGTILRFSLIIGEDGGIVKDFEKTLFGPFAIIPGSGQSQIQPILREDAARCIVEAVAKPELLGKIIELGGPEVVTYETIFDWFLQARRLKKTKLRLPAAMLTPGA